MNGWYLSLCYVVTVKPVFCLLPSCICHPLYSCSSVACLSFPIESSLTATNICSVLADVKDWWGIWGLPYYLQIPSSKVKEMEQLYPDLSQRQSALIQLWLDQHPAPSWELVCWALYVMQEYEVLKNVQNNYLKGILQCNSIVRVPHVCTIFNFITNLSLWGVWWICGSHK